LFPLPCRRLTVCFALLAALAILPSRLNAASASQTPDPWLDRAREQERDHRWFDACRSYEELIRRDRDQAEYRLGYHRCLRHYQLARRHKDAAYRQALARLTPAHALDVYEQVLTTVGAYYFDRPRADVASLFQNGLQELEFALDEPAFLKTYLPQTEDNPAALQAFRDQLNDWRSRKITSRAEARDGVLTLARAAQEAGLAPKQSSVVPAFALEFACGSCDALDEYTLLLTPGRDAAPKVKPGPSVHHEMLTEDFSTTPGGPPLFAGLIAISQFQESTTQEMREALFDLTSRGAKGLIIDVRGNPGGLFKVAVQVAEMFVGEGVIVYSQGQIKEYNHPFEARGGHVYSLPILLLVDGDTASAAEVLAGAMKELGRAQLIGQQTFGKGSVQAVFPLDQPPLDRTPGAIRLTVAKLLSPGKQPYTGRGVLPDIDVPLGEDILDAARIHLRPLLNPMPVAPPG
jgi:Peptidase family S41